MKTFFVVFTAQINVELSILNYGSDLNFCAHILEQMCSFFFNETEKHFCHASHFQQISTSIQSYRGTCK